MACPPGSILNPKTVRCIKLDGRVAQQLIKNGNIADYYAVPPHRPSVYRPLAKTYKAPKALPPPLFYYDSRPKRAPKPAPAPGPYYYDPHRYTYKAGLKVACPPGSQRNPRTGRCIKLAGKTFKDIYGAPAVDPAAPYYPAAAIPVPRPRARPYAYPPPEPYLPVAAAARAKTLRRTSSEEAIRLPVGTATPGPLTDRSNILRWIRHNCDNDRDPLTGMAFSSADTDTLQEVIRLHNGTCTLATPLNDKVTAEHKAGQIATMPGDPSTHMTLDDFKALRDTVRRKIPGYKIPARKHQPPPPNWQLYVASDNRSGPEYAAVMFVDVTKIIHTPAGVQYPLESVRIDLGFIPLTIRGGLCSPQTVVELIRRLSEENRLLTPVPGGWSPVAGFPFKKSHWSGPEDEVRERFNRFCRDLTRALSTPI